VNATSKDKPAKKLEIKIDNSLFFASMLEKQAPNTCKVVLDLLPLDCELFHATWSGDMLFCKCHGIPGKLEPENSTIYPSRGDIGLNSHLKELQLVYGQAQFRARSGPAPDNLFARVIKNIDEFEEIGKKIHREGAKKISIKIQL
jgi:hypothetical protein